MCIRDRCTREIGAKAIELLTKSFADPAAPLETCLLYTARYGFPSVSRMLAILEELSAARFNTFLLEYENRFPFEAYPDIADPAHFTPADLRRIQERAAALQDVYKRQVQRYERGKEVPQSISM